MPLSEHYRRLLVILPSPMGDAILATPALRRLRRALPNSQISYLANSTVDRILSDCPWSDDRLEYPTHQNGRIDFLATIGLLRRRHFDAVLLLSNSFRSALLTHLARIPRRIGYRRDGRGPLLNCPLDPLRLPGRFAPISMLDYYRRLIDHAIGSLGARPDQTNAKSDVPLQLFTSPADHKEVDTLLQQWRLNPADRLVVLVPGGAFGPSKCWSPERFAQLADRLTQQLDCRVILSCAPIPAEQTIAHRIAVATDQPVYNLADRPISIGALKELIRRSRLVVANDTGPCHIAAAFDVPLVTIFGPTDPRWTATGYKREIRLRHTVDCGPCQQPHCKLDHRCLTAITVDDVFSAARCLIDPSHTPPADHSGTINTHSYSPFDEQFVPLSDATGLALARYMPLLRQNKLACLDDVFRYELGTALTKPGLDRSRRRFRVELTDTDNRSAVLFLKRYEHPGCIALLKRLVTRRSRAAAAAYDFTAAGWLAEAAIPVARPVAFGQQLGPLGERRSFVISEQLPHADALERILPRRHELIDTYPILAENRALIDQIARLVHRLHNAGFYHRDLYLSHIFLGHSDAGNDTLSLIDLQRVFRPIVLHRRWMIKDLAQLYYSASDYFSRTDTIRFLHRYFDCDHLTDPQKRLVRAVDRKARRIALHDRKRTTRLAETTP